MGGVFGKNPSRPCCIFQASKRLSVFLTVKVVVIIMESNIVGKLELPPFSKELKKAPVIGSHGEKSTTFILIFCLENKGATCPQSSSVFPDPLVVTALEWDRENGLLHENNFSV